MAARKPGDLYVAPPATFKITGRFTLLPHHSLISPFPNYEHKMDNNVRKLANLRLRADQKPIPEQIQVITQKWDPSNPNCAFKTYLYNKVDEHAAPLYQPGPNDDPKEWEEALAKKPAPNYIPVLCAGFPAIVARLLLQRRVITEFNNKLHAINASLDEILSRHDLEHSVRALKARRRHAELSKRCLALASRVQVLRNRGYALSSDEDELKQKLAKIDKNIQDPALSARMEELWSRLIILRGYADNLKDEINKPGFAESDGLGEEVEAKAKKVCFPVVGCPNAVNLS